MSDDEQSARIRRLEVENARLRDLLDGSGRPCALRHPVRNTLALLRAILRRSAEGKTSVEDFVAHLEGRFDALLRVQTAVSMHPDGQVDLATLVSDEFLAQTIEEGARATIDGQPVRLDPHQAELLGLAIHELATNALKFGALTALGGHIDVSWSVSADRRLILVWTESGHRPDAPQRSVRGFGMEAIETMLPCRLGAETELEFMAEGLRCTLIVPIEA